MRYSLGAFSIRLFCQYQSLISSCLVNICPLSNAIFTLVHHPRCCVRSCRFCLLTSPGLAMYRGNKPIAGPGKYLVKRLHRVLPRVLASPGRCPLSRDTDRTSRGHEVQCSESNIARTSFNSDSEVVRRRIADFLAYTRKEKSKKK
jgi:hypothetical protein